MNAYRKKQCLDCTSGNLQNGALLKYASLNCPWIAASSACEFPESPQPLGKSCSAVPPRHRCEALARRGTQSNVAGSGRGGRREKSSKNLGETETKINRLSKSASHSYNVCFKFEIILSPSPRPCDNQNQ